MNTIVKVLTAFWLCTLIFPVSLKAQQPRKIAFVVGVSEYQKDGLTNLNYAHKDANDLSMELSNNGFEVTKLIGNEAKHKEIRNQFQKFIATAAELGKKDVVLVSFSGHGVQKLVSEDGRQVETPFFCVYDTMVSKPETMISLNSVLQQLKNDSGCSNNLLIVDACRNNPDKGARTLDGSTVKELPTKISMLFSSSPGQKSFESEKVNQGIFTHVLLKGLRGDAANSRGQVKWASLATYVLEEVPLHTADLLEDSSIQQRPNLVGNFVRSPILVIPTKVPLLSAPFGEKEIAAVITALGRSKGMKPVIKNDIGMEFRLIPAGKFTMGSPETEKDRGDDEHQHEVEITRSFYMGMYEVTQSQWERVMGHNPSAFSLSGKLKADVEGINTGNFPVESVSWEEANTFLDRMNSRFGISGFRYCLPTEAEWEYACRGGSETTFHFGDVLTSKNANFSNRRKRTVEVGSYKANGFGLYDMSGNLFELCNDRYDKHYYSRSPTRDPSGPKEGKERVFRGGCWRYGESLCRSAGRYSFSPTSRHDYIGFRVALSP